MFLFVDVGGLSYELSLGEEVLVVVICWIFELFFNKLIFEVFVRFGIICGTNVLFI